MDDSVFHFTDLVFFQSLMRSDWWEDLVAVQEHWRWRTRRSGSRCTSCLAGLCMTQLLFVDVWTVAMLFQHAKYPPQAERQWAFTSPTVFGLDLLWESVQQQWSLPLLWKSPAQVRPSGTSVSLSKGKPVWKISLIIMRFIQLYYMPIHMTIWCYFLHFKFYCRLILQTVTELYCCMMDK